MLVEKSKIFELSFCATFERINVRSRRTENE